MFLRQQYDRGQHNRSMGAGRHFGILHLNIMEIIFAAAVSGLAQWLKRYSPNEYLTLLMVVGLSVAAAGIHVALQAASFWQSALEILTIAAAIYTFITQRFSATRA
jgi:hypothetical protein